MDYLDGVQKGDKLYLICRWLDDPYGAFDVIGWSGDEGLLQEECMRLERKAYRINREQWINSGGDPKFGPIAPEDRRDGYMAYHVRAAAHWLSPKH